MFDAPAEFVELYDVLFEADVLYKTDEWVYRVLMAEEFCNRTMGTAELHHRIGAIAHLLGG